MSSRSKGRGWLTVVSLLGIACLSLTIHVLMLEWFHVPYPHYSGVGNLGLLYPFGHVLGLMLAYSFAAPLFPRRLVQRVAAVAVADAVITEVFRMSIMNGVTSKSVLFPAISMACGLVDCLVLAILVVLAGSRVRGLPGKTLLSALIATVMTFVVGPITHRPEQALASLQRPALFQEPYGPVVLSISYATFTATVAAALATIRMIGPQLGRPAWRNAARACVILLLIRGTLVAQVFFPWKMKAGPASGAVSASQFFLEDLTFMLLVWLYWWKRQSGAGSRDPASSR